MPVPPEATAKVADKPAAVPVVFWFSVGNVQFVNVPEDGVPKTPPFTTGAPAVPTFTANAVATPVPRPDTPVEIGSPVAFVNVPDVGVPKAGVTSVGLVANTKAPEPVSFVTAAAKLAEEGVAKNVATPVPKPDTPVEIGRPVALVSVPDEGVPKTPPLTKGAPAVPTFTAKAAATPVPKPDTPVEIGSPVVFVRVPDAGVPKLGATSVGPFDKTTLVVPVDAVTPVPPLATGNVPVTPVVIGKPVQLVKTPEAGVPSAGVTSVGLVANTKEPEPVSLVTAAAKLAEDGVAKNVATPVPSPETPVEIGSPVAFVSVPEVGVPSAGVTSVGDVSVPPATVGEMRCVFCWVKFVPSLHTVIVLPVGMATPVPAAVVLPITVEL